MHDKTVTSSSQSSLATSTFGIADMLLAGWRPEAYVFVLLLAARRPEEAYDICCWLLGVRKRMIVVAGGPAQGSWRLCSQVASYTKLAFSSNSNNSIPTTCQVSLLEDVQIHLPRSCRDQVSPSVLRQKPTNQTPEDVLKSCRSTYPLFARAPLFAHKSGVI